MQQGRLNSRVKFRSASHATVGQISVGINNQIKAAGYNLDQKNPHIGEQQSHDPDELLADYARLQAEAQALRDELKGILAHSLSAKTAASA